MRITLCDDEKIFIDSLAKEIEEITAYLGVKIIIDSYYQGYELLDNFKNQYDVIFQEITL